MDFGELKTVIAEYLGRTDGTTTQIEGFVTRAENRIGERLRADVNREISSPAITPSSGAVTLPARCKEIVQVSTGAGASLVILRPITVDGRQRYGVSGKAKAYYQVSDTVIQLVPASDDDVILHYYVGPEPLAGEVDGTTRPELTAHESLYIDGALAEASIRYRDYDAASWFTARFDAAIDRINTQHAQFSHPVTTTAQTYTAAPPRAL